jgi:DNA replication protein DnaC
MIESTVQKLSHELRLFGVHAGFEARAQEAVSKNLHPLEFLSLVLEDEKLQRKDRFAKSLKSRAKFRLDAHLVDWDMSYDRGISKAQLKELSLLSFYRSKENLILLGKTGEGKTHLAISLGRQLCDEGLSVAFLPVNLICDEMLAAKASGKYLGYLNRLHTTKALIFDDFGLRCYTHEEAMMFIELLEARVKKGPIIVTSQVDPKGWYKLFEDPVVAEAVVDRMINPSQKVNLKGGTYRGKLAELNKELAQKTEVQ